MTSEQKNKALEFITDKNPAFMAPTIAFMSKGLPYPPSFFKTETNDPVAWWRALSTFDEFPEGFVEFMETLCISTASSAGVERVFSSFGLIHNKLRNRLGVDTASKLVFCYRMLRGNKELDY